MRILFVACLTSLAVPCAVPAPAQDAKKGVAELQGIWRLVATVSSTETREMPTTEPRWIIKGDTVMYGGEPLAKLKVDAAATPRIIDLDFIEKKRVYEAIFTLVGDRLTICVNIQADGVKERPLDFTVAGNDNRRLFVLQREKPGAGDGNADGPGFIGVQIANTPDGIGVLVGLVVEKGPARKAGIQPQDVVLKVGTTAVTGIQQMIDRVRRVRPGSDVVFRIRRGDKEQDITIRVGVAPFSLLE